MKCTDIGKLRLEQMVGATEMQLFFSNCLMLGDSLAPPFLYRLWFEFKFSAFHAKKVELLAASASVVCFTVPV